MNFQVVAGQLVGTLFNLDAAKALEQEMNGEEDGVFPPVKKQNKTSRDQALESRQASRVLQSLSSEVGN